MFIINYMICLYLPAHRLHQRLIVLMMLVFYATGAVASKDKSTATDTGTSNQPGLSIGRVIDTRTKTNTGISSDSVSPAETDGAPDDQTLPDTLSVTTRPRWEFGIGAAAVSGYDYPASNDVNRRTIALPFFIYRSPVLRFGGGGIKAVALEQPRVRLDVSVGGSLNASAEGDGPRVGMPDLDFLFELGPQLEVHLFEHRLDSGAYWLGRFSSELRAVFSTDFGSIESQGYVFEAGVGAGLRNLRQSRVDLFTSLDVAFASERLQDYFYEVGPEFVTADRPVYDARGGYLESSLFLGIAYRARPSVRLFAGIGKSFSGNAANERSPLFETTQQTVYALGLVWTIKSSQSVIDVVEMGDPQ